MWEGVRIFLNGLVEDEIMHELIKINPQLKCHERRRLQEMAKRASDFATAGDVKRAMLQIRSCLVVSIQSVRDPEVLATVHAMLNVIPCGKFEEPPSIVISDYMHYEKNENDCDSELRTRFGVKSTQYLGISLERRQALLLTLRYRAMNPPVTCPICWDELLNGDQLLDDVVAVFEEEPLPPCTSDMNSYLCCKNPLQELSAVTIIEDTRDINDLNVCIPHSSSCKDFRFATSFVDSFFMTPVKQMTRLFSLLTIPSSEDHLNDNFIFNHTLNHLNTMTIKDSCIPDNATHLLETNQLPASIEDHPRLDIIYLNKASSSSSFSKKDKKGRSSLFIVQPSSLKDDIKILSDYLEDSVIDASKPSIRIPGITTVLPVTDSHSNMNTPKIIIRCHLYKGSFLREWFDMGHWVNPMTRSPILPEDWCRLTNSH